MILGVFAPENTEIESEHVKCGNACNCILNSKEKFVAVESGGENFIFTEEA